MTHRSLLSSVAFTVVPVVLAVACGGGSEDSATSTGAAGTSSSGAAGASAGKAGSTAAGNAGTAGGLSGSGGTAGTSGAGAGGAAGKAGASGAGAAGASGKGGASGGAGAGAGGVAGAAGKAGASGAGAAGASGAGAGGASGAGASGAGASGAGAGGAGAAGVAGSAGAGGACVSDTVQATLKQLPVDIIIVIDNSGSMGNDIIGVQDNINQNFNDIISASGLDYRVIMFSRHGSATGAQSICVSMPLSGHACMPIPAQPVNTSKFFQYSVEVGSTNSLSLLISKFSTPDEFNLAPMGWSQWLRKDAFKIFLEISDDNSSLAAATFDTQLLALPGGHFGTAQKRNYRFHGIIGVAANNPPTAPYLPTDPVVTTDCGAEAVNASPQHQNLAILTGGLRFPICDKTKFDVVFQQIAKGVVDSASVACDFAIPPNPPGKVIDPDTIVVNYTPGNGGPVVSYKQVKDASMCTASSFYVAAGTVHLCPAVCTAVQTDLKAKMSIEFGCGAKP